MPVGGEVRRATSPSFLPAGLKVAFTLKLLLLRLADAPKGTRAGMKGAAVLKGAELLYADG